MGAGLAAPMLLLSLLSPVPRNVKWNLRRRTRYSTKTVTMLRIEVKATALFFLVLFIAGVLLVPAHHRAHCDDHAAARNDSDCPVCQMANTPWVAPVSPGAPQPVLPAEIAVFPTVLTTVISSFLAPTQARAPPAV